MDYQEEVTPLKSKKNDKNHLIRLDEIKEQEAWSDWRFSSTIWAFPVGKFGREGVHGLEDRERKFYHTFRNPNKLYVNTAFAGKLVPHLVRKLIHKYSAKGDLILDAFCGSGTIPVEAKLNGRRCIAIDLNKKCVSLTKRKLAALNTFSENAHQHASIDVREGDARELGFIKDDSIDLVLTHPPYWGLIDFSEFRMICRTLNSRNTYWQ